MKKKSIKILKIIIPLSLGIFLIWYSLGSASPEEREELLNNIVNANPYWVAVSFILGTLSHLSRAYRWKYLLEPMGYRSRLGNSFMAVMVAYLANFGIPRSGEVLRAVTLTSYEKVPFEKGFGTIISERIADLLILLCVIGIALSLHADNLLAYFSENDINPLYTFAIFILLIGIMLLVLRFIKKSNWAIAIKLKKIAKGMLEGMRSILNMKHKWPFILHTIFIWTMYVLMFHAIKFSIPETSSLDLGVILAAFVVGSFAVSATNGGIGVYPLAVAGILMYFGVSKEGAEAFGWISWTTQTCVVLLFGGLSFIFLPLYNRHKNN